MRRFNQVLILLSSNLTAIGAILTILALGFDAVTQQVLDLMTLPVAGGDSAFYIAGDVPRSIFDGSYEHGCSFELVGWSSELNGSLS